MSDRPTVADLLAADPRDSGCAGALEIIDQYVDLETAGEDASERFPGVAAHLRSCPGCRVDHEGLLAAAADERRRGTST